MKAKSCTQCRQRKARCEYDGDPSEGCRRCRSRRIQCVYDAAYQRASTSKTIQRMVGEINDLRQALNHSHSLPPPCTAAQGISAVPALPVSSTVAQSSSAVPALPTFSPSNVLPTTTSQPDTGAASADFCYRLKSSDVTLLPQQAREHFRFFFLRCHAHLPFVVRSKEPLDVYDSSPLLFWTIIAASAGDHWELRSRLSAPLRAMLAETLHITTRTVEMVQALLIMVTWPLPIPNISQDTSDFYCAFATQMALSLGLHRSPTQAHIQKYGSEEQLRLRETESSVKTSTWRACYVASQQQFLYRGVPQQVWLDRATISSIVEDEIQTLDHISQACRLHYVFMQANLAIGDGSPARAGMLDPPIRIERVNEWIAILDKTAEPLTATISDELMVSLLLMRMQLWSYGILDDVPLDTSKRNCAQGAEESATSIIRIVRNQNLATAPATIRRAMTYGGLTLVKVLRSGVLTGTAQAALHDSIEYVRQGLRATTNATDDIWLKASETVPALIWLPDRNLSPHIYSRFGASLVYDVLRIWEENKIVSAENGAEQTESEQTIDLDGFDWSLWLDVAGT